MKYMMANTMNAGYNDCDVFVQDLNDTLPTDTNTVRLGDPFFSAFLPVFDVDSQKIGLAVASRALSDVTQTTTTTTEETPEMTRVEELLVTQ